MGRFYGQSDAREMIRVSRLVFGLELRDESRASLRVGRRPIHSRGVRSELQPRLEGDHPWTAVATQPDSQQAGRRGGRVGEGSKSTLRGGISRNAGLNHVWKRKIRMIENIEELPFKPQLHVLAQGKPFCQIEVTPEKIWTTQCVTAEASESAILRTVAAVALPCTGIDRRHEGVRIEPLQRSHLGYARNRMMVIQRNAGNDTSELRPAALHNSGRSSV